MLVMPHCMPNNRYYYPFFVFESYVVFHHDGGWLATIMMNKVKVLEYCTNKKKGIKKKKRIRRKT